MKRMFLAFALGIIFTSLLAFTASSFIAQKNTATVEQVQGLYIFVKSVPVADYEYIGTVKGPTFGDHEFDNLLESMIKRTKKDFPEANAIIFDGTIKQTHNTKVSAVKIKELTQ